MERMKRAKKAKTARLPLRPSTAVTRWARPIDSERWAQRIAARGDEMRLAWSEFLSRLAWEWFVTLTFREERPEAFHDKRASKEAFWWAGQLARLRRRPIGWVYAVEQGGNGTRHIHVLIIGAGHRFSQAARMMWAERNGHADVQAVYDGLGASLYTSKSAAARSELVLSDTLNRYPEANGRPRLLLCPGDSEEV